MLIFCFPESGGPPLAHREELPRLLPGGDHDKDDNSENNEYVDEDDINDDTMTTPLSPR